MLKILLVDDTEDNLDMLARRLRKRGYEVVVAVDGAEACRQASAELPQLILMDMQMPVMDGYAATRSIKAADETSHIPIIGLTAYAMEGDREAALASGCDDYEAKPINFPQLLAKMQTLLDRSTTE